MILTRLIANAIRGRSMPAEGLGDATAGMPSVLNVGGGSKQIGIPSHYADWNHILLDIAPGADVDVVLDARSLATFHADRFDAVYCSHNLEHYYRHDCARVLAGFVHVLKPNGYAEIRVPDMSAVFRAIVSKSLDIDDVLYTVSGAPISVHDVIYGWGIQIEKSGVDFFAHKRGFTVRSLTATLQQAGFAQVMTAIAESIFEIRALGFKSEPTEEQKRMFGL